VEETVVAAHKVADVVVEEVAVDMAASVDMAALGVVVLTTVGGFG
jgi:hypothetical protein